MTDTVDATGDGAAGLGGRRFVLILYAALIAISGLMGALFTVAVDDPSPPALFFLVELPSTAGGFALYGAVTVAVVLGLPLLLVVFVSEYVDDVDSVGRADVPERDADGGNGDGDDDSSDGEATARDVPSSESPKD